MSTINTMHTITSPNIMMNALPPIAMAEIVITDKISKINARIVNNIIIHTSLIVFIKGYVIIANKKKESLGLLFL